MLSVGYFVIEEEIMIFLECFNLDIIHLYLQNSLQVRDKNNERESSRS